MMPHFVYILYSESIDKFYKGQTDDIHGRLIRHNNGYESATRNGIPWILLWKIEKPTRSSAMILEQKLKNLSKKRLLEFLLKYSEGVEGPDEFFLLEKLSGC